MNPQQQALNKKMGVKPKPTLVLTPKKPQMVMTPKAPQPVQPAPSKPLPNPTQRAIYV